jgi:hypothetical protein
MKRCILAWSKLKNEQDNIAVGDPFMHVFDRKSHASRVLCMTEQILMIAVGDPKIL